MENALISKDVHCFYKFNKKYDDELNKQVETFWFVDSFGTMQPYYKENMTKEEKGAIKILEPTIPEIENYCEGGLLWKENNLTILNYNKDMAARRYNLTKRKFRKNDELAIKYKETINVYISREYTRKQSQEEGNQTAPMTNYTPHHGIQNPSKPGKLRVVFGAATYFSNACLNNHLLSGPDHLNNLVGDCHDL